MLQQEQGYRQFHQRCGKMSSVHQKFIFWPSRSSTQMSALWSADRVTWQPTWWPRISAVIVRFCNERVHQITITTANDARITRERTAKVFCFTSHVINPFAKTSENPGFWQRFGHPGNNDEMRQSQLPSDVILQSIMSITIIISQKNSSNCARQYLLRMSRN